MRRSLCLFLLILFCAGVGKSLYYIRDGFSLRKVGNLSLPADQNWSHEVESALSQPFSYLGRGRQCFAFASEDGKYVLKLPRTDIYQLPFWARALPFRSHREKLKEIRRERQSFILESFHIAFEELQTQTGVLALHLGRSEPKGKTLTIIDTMGQKYRLPLEKTAFALQYKQPILIKAFLAKLQAKERAEAGNILSALLDVIVERAQKGILNRDRSFLRNYGYDGKRAYQIDVGSFFRKECSNPCQKSIYDSIDPVQEWLAEIDPQMLQYFNARLEERFTATN